MLKGFFDWLLPSRCAVTGDIVDDHAMVSTQVWKQITFITRPFCARCGSPFEINWDDDEPDDSLVCGYCMEHPPEFSQARSAMVYDNGSRGLILAFKHGDKTLLAPTLAKWMMNALSERDREVVDICMPVPLHRMRLLKRRYNQAALLCGAVAKQLGKGFYPDGLLRLRSTPPMEGKNRTQRQDNVRGVFAVNAKYADSFKGKTILLVDDVYTTGATVNACARALLKVGAKEVMVLCVARVVYNGG